MYSTFQSSKVNPDEGALLIDDTNHYEGAHVIQNQSNKLHDFKKEGCLGLKKRSIIGRVEEFQKIYDWKNEKQQGAKKYEPKSRISVMFMNNIKNFLLRYAKNKSLSENNDEAESEEKLF